MSMSDNIPEDVTFITADITCDWDNKSSKFWVRKRKSKGDNCLKNHTSKSITLIQNSSAPVPQWGLHSTLGVKKIFISHFSIFRFLGSLSVFRKRYFNMSPTLNINL